MFIFCTVNICRYFRDHSGYGFVSEGTISASLFCPILVWIHTCIYSIIILCIQYSLQCTAMLQKKNKFKLYAGDDAAVETLFRVSLHNIKLYNHIILEIKGKLIFSNHVVQVQ